MTYSWAGQAVALHLEMSATALGCGFLTATHKKLAGAVGVCRDHEWGQGRAYTAVSGVVVGILETK